MSDRLHKPCTVLRRLLQFRLRTLLLAMTAVSIWVAVYAHRARRQQQAVRAIRDSGGWFYYDFQEQPPGSGKFNAAAEPPVPDWLVAAFGDDFLFDVAEVNLVYNEDSGKRQDNTNLSGDVLRHVAALPKLKWLLLKEGQATDDGLKFVGGLHDLEALYMWDASDVTDAGISHLAGLKKLKTIHVSNSQIGDPSLVVLSTLPALEELSLQCNHFTDAGLAHLRGNTVIRRLCGLGGTDVTDQGAAFLSQMPNLEHIYLQHTNVTAAALEHLKRLTKLKWLLLFGTQIDDGAARQFERARPKCKLAR